MATEAQHFNPPYKYFFFGGGVGGAIYLFLCTFINQIEMDTGCKIKNTFLIE